MILAASWILQPLVSSLTGASASFFVLSDLTPLADPSAGSMLCCSSGVDFEQAFINALRKMFPRARLIGCFFHWKQAIRRKLKDLGFPDGVVSHLMKPGRLDLLTVMPIDDVKSVESKGPMFVAMLIETAAGDKTIKLQDGSKIPLHEWFNSDEGSTKMILFWQYMQRQWFGKNGVTSLWNLSDLKSKSSGVFRYISRTNCALERYNGTINKEYPTKNPNLCVFAEALDKHTDKRVFILNEAAKGRRQKTEYDDIPFPEFPDEQYAEFVMPSLEFFSLTGKKKAAAPVVAVATNGKSERSDSEPTGHSPVKKSARTAGKSAAAPVVRKSKRVAGRKKKE